jgi:hypothetical protein
MASWKKMAEAFGRAFQQHGFKGKNGGTGSKVLDRAQYTAMGDEDLNKAFKQGRKNESDIENETYRRFQENYDGTQTGEDLGRTYDNVLDETSDKRLVENRDKEWNDAFRHAQGVMELPDDEMNDVLRSLIKDLKSRGFAEQDILNSLRSLGAK